MNTKRFHMIALLVLFFFSVQQTAFAQLPLFGGPTDQNFCMTSGAIPHFDAFYINDSPALAPTDFSYTSTDVTIMLTAPALGTGNTFSTTATGSSGALYELIIKNAGNDYTVQLFILSGIAPALSGMQYSCIAADGVPTTSSPGELTVATPITVSIVSPATFMTTACETETVMIDASTSAVPDSYEWIKDGITNVGVTEDLTLAAVTIAQSGIYQLTIIDAGCPNVFSSPVTVLVVPSALITDTDMAAKELAVGETKTFTATADNVDGTSTYTWTIGGTPFMAGALPATVVVGGNTIEVNSIVNSGVGLSSVASTVSLSNISAPGAPSFSADVELTVSNNTACVSTTATAMSSTTTVFPVEWSYFLATAENNKTVALKWATETETNNDKFIIERSIDGKTFVEIGEMTGAGTTYISSEYSWTDTDHPSTQALIYRLRQIDFDGAESFSEVKIVQLRSSGISVGAVSFSAEWANVQIISSVEGIADLQIYDARGVPVLQKDVYVNGGLQVTNFALPAVRGIYFLRLKLGNEEVVTSFVN